MTDLSQTPTEVLWNMWRKSVTRYLLARSEEGAILFADKADAINAELSRRQKDETQ